MFSQTCVQRPPLGPQNSGRCSQGIYALKVPNETQNGGRSTQVRQHCHKVTTVFHRALKNGLAYLTCEICCLSKIDLNLNKTI